VKIGFVLAGVAALGLAGCVGPPPGRYPREPAPRAPAPLPAPTEAPLGERAYQEGYTDGWRDREAGISPDHTRHATPYQQNGAREFRSGYADGYQRRPHRHGGGVE
jgi:hypothetical protein